MFIPWPSSISFHYSLCVNRYSSSFHPHHHSHLPPIFLNYSLLFSFATPSQSFIHFELYHSSIFHVIHLLSVIYHYPLASIPLSPFLPSPNDTSAAAHPSSCSLFRIHRLTPSPASGPWTHFCLHELFIHGSDFLLITHLRDFPRFFFYFCCVM